MQPDNEKKLSIYRTMYLAQQWEMGLLRMIDDGKVSGFYHAGRGSEGSEVGAVAALRNDDYLLYDHRGCAHMIAKGMSLVELYGDFLGNMLGSTKGLGAGIVHIADPACGVLGQSGTLGGGHVLAAGAGLSISLRKSDQVCVNFFGDGAANRGTFHEAANVAGAWKLPVVFIVQNNGWAISVPVEYSTGGGGFARRADAYGMEGALVDGMDAFAVYDVVDDAVRRAREGGGPTLIEATTARFRGHFEGDPVSYRSKESLAEEKLRDPVLAARAHLLDTRIAADTELLTMEAEVRDEVEAAATESLTGEAPPADRIFQHVYA